MLTINEIQNTFGKFEYKDLNNGLITIDPLWTSNNLVLLETSVGVTKCHKLLKPIFIKIFNQIKKEELSAFITFSMCGGIWIPRKKFYDRKQDNSTHAWGISCDLNVKNNPYGRISYSALSFSKDNLSTYKVIQIFEENGFSWGGRTLPLNPAHLEFTDLTKLK